MAYSTGIILVILCFSSFTAHGKQSLWYNRIFHNFSVYFNAYIRARESSELKGELRIGEFCSDLTRKAVTCKELKMPMYLDGQQWAKL